MLITDFLIDSNDPFLFYSNTSAITIDNLYYLCALCVLLDSLNLKERLRININHDTYSRDIFKHK